MLWRALPDCALAHILALPTMLARLPLRSGWVAVLPAKGGVTASREDLLAFPEMPTARRPQNRWFPAHRNGRNLTDSRQKTAKNVDFSAVYGRIRTNLEGKMVPWPEPHKSSI